MVSHMFHVHRGRWSQYDKDSMYFQNPGPWVYFEWIIPFFQGSESTSPYISMVWQTQRLQRLIRGYHFFRLVSSQQLRSASTLFSQKTSEHFFWSKNTPTCFSFFLSKQTTPFCNIMHVLDVCVSFGTNGSYAWQPTSLDESWHTSISWRVSTVGWSTPKTLDRLILGTKMAKNTPMKFCIVD